MGMAFAASVRRLKNGGRHPTIGTTRLAGWKTMTDKKILLVDDEVDVLRVFARALGKIGYTVYTAVRGSAALEILRNETIQVMFFDLNMPEMNGLELCRRARKEFPTAVIHAVTGYGATLRVGGLPGGRVRPLLHETGRARHADRGCGVRLREDGARGE